MLPANKISLASETVLYAAQCLRSDECELALDVIRDEASLTQEQSKAIEKIIGDLGTAKLTPKELNLAEAHMLDVLAPDPRDLIGRRIEQLYKRVKFADQKTLLMIDILNPRLPFRNCDLRDLDNLERSLNWVDFFACFPELENLELDANGVDFRPIAEGIKISCPKFKCVKMALSHMDMDNGMTQLCENAKTLIWSPRNDCGCCKYDLNCLAKLPFLTELIFKVSLDEAVYLKPEIFDQFTRLERLTITSKFKNNNDRRLIALAHFPNLQAIDIRKYPLSHESIRQFALAKRQTLRQMTLSLSDGLNKSQFVQLQTEMPTILFTLVEEEK